MAYEVLRPLSDWHEDDGDVLWYRVPIHEPPFVSSPLSSDWLIETSDGRCVEVDDEEEDHKPWATHWCRLPRVIFEPWGHDEIKRLRTAIADAASVMSSIYESFRDGEKIDPAVVDIGIGCWLEKHAPDSLQGKDGD